MDNILADTMCTMKKASAVATHMDTAPLRRDRLDTEDQKDQLENPAVQGPKDLRVTMVRMVHQENQEKRVNEDLPVIKDHLEIPYMLHAPLKENKVNLDP